MSSPVAPPSPRRKVLFITGTRADYSKLKKLMHVVEASPFHELHVFVTGMHMLKLYGSTYVEVVKDGYQHIHPFVNQHVREPMESIFGNTISGLSRWVRELEPDLIVVHGDRCEALAGASVGAMSNTLVCHIEGGEVSGTIDEAIRHATSKLSHIHMVSNEEAAARLRSMGEAAADIYVIGSPDLDVMCSADLPSFAMVRDHYRIAFEPQGFILSIFHPVTTEVGAMPEHTAHYFDALLQVGLPVVAIFPNNDSGNEAILARLQALAENPLFRIFPSVRFEAFLSILKHARCIAGNSSAGVREAPFYGVPSVDVGTRQTGRYNGPTVLHADYATSSVVASVKKALTMERGASCTHFGDGSSVEKFYEALHSDKFWKTDVQKMYHAND